MLGRLWNEHVYPRIVERACRSSVILEERKRWVPEASGAVLEIGVGTGLNFPFYDPVRVTNVVALEPARALRERATVRIPDARVPIELVDGDAQALGFERACFDTIVTTYSLCSIAKPGQALSEMLRVLRHDGRLILVEHGLAPDPNAARWQRRLTPMWRRIGGNCHLDREVRRELVDAGFVVGGVTAEFEGDGPRWLSFTYQGIARPAKLSKAASAVSTHHE